MKLRMVGKEIKGISTFVGFIISIPLVLIGVALFIFANEEGTTELYIVGVVTILIGVIIAWLFTILLYGYGELIDQTMQTHYAVRVLHNMLFKKLDETNEAVSSEVKILTEINKNLMNRT